MLQFSFSWTNIILTKFISPRFKKYINYFKKSTKIILKKIIYNIITSSVLKTPVTKLFLLINVKTLPKCNQNKLKKCIIFCCYTIIKIFKIFHIYIRKSQLLFIEINIIFSNILYVYVNLVFEFQKTNT